MLIPGIFPGNVQFRVTCPSSENSNGTARYSAHSWIHRVQVMWNNMRDCWAFWLQMFIARPLNSSRWSPIWTNLPTSPYSYYIITASHPLRHFVELFFNIIRTWIERGEEHVKRVINFNFEFVRGSNGSVL